MDYDGITLTDADKARYAIDRGIKSTEITFRVTDATYYLLEQMANYNGINMPHLIRTIVEQKLKL